MSVSQIIRSFLPVQLAQWERQINLKPQTALDTTEPVTNIDIPQLHCRKNL